MPSKKRSLLAASSAGGDNYDLWGWGKADTNGSSASNLSNPAQIGEYKPWAGVFSGNGAAHTLAIRDDGTLWSWGLGASGVLGLGNTTTYGSPKQIGTLTTWATASAGGTQSLAIKTDGTLWAWGDATNYGQLGLGNTTDYSSPKQVGALTAWLKVSAGGNHSMAIKTDGTLWSWGNNQYGALGLGNTTNYSSPKQVGALTNWSTISCGGIFNAAIKTDGTLWTWGWGNEGRLGHGNTTSYSSPKQVGALTTWASANAGYSNGGAVKTDGTLWNWGENAHGELGQGNTVNRSSPVQLGALTDWSTISGGSHFVMALKTDQTLWNIGGYSGQGRTGTGSGTYYSSPVQIGADANWYSIGTGNAHGAAIRL
jgi:alpha-tubulin suppressor-like RCC1 family protein